jgi:hypothetical protein
MADERSGIHLTGEDSGWPVASDAEPDPHKDGSGTDALPKAQAIAGGDVTASEEVESAEVTSQTTFTITFQGQTTSPIAAGATGPTVLAALEALSNIAPGDVSVVKRQGVYTITFLEAGAYGDTNVPQMTASGATITTQAEGS